MLTHPTPTLSDLCLMSWQQGDGVVRPITPDDDRAVCDLICNTLAEHGCIGEGYASQDEETQAMHRYYDGETSQYWVIVKNAGEVLGGGGFARLKGTLPDDGIAELQKLYFHPSLRGQGFGKRLIQHIEKAAAQSGFRRLYLETTSHMENAIGLYQHLGFTPLSQPLGETGHAERCAVRMVKVLAL